MSRRRRGRPAPWVPPGIFALAKERGPTSHDLVDFVRKLLPRGARVGHGGTLDPFAEGVLPICVGGATRLADRVGEGSKVYLAELRLDATTATGDLDGEVVARHARPADFETAGIEAAAAELTGEIMQVPPAYSAVRVGGKRAYELARAGEAPELAARPVTIHRIELLEVGWPRVRFRVECGRGTYVRVLGEDLGKAVGAGGHLTRLVRERVGPLVLAEASTPFQVVAAGVPACYTPLEEALGGLPRVTLAGPQVERVLCGGDFAAADLADPAELPPGDLVLYAAGEGFPLALAHLDAGRIRPVRVFGRAPPG